MPALSENDRYELAKFRLYLEACARWNKANDTLPDFAPIGDLEGMEWQKKQIKAHAAIYEQVYGEKP